MMVGIRRNFMCCKLKNKKYMNIVQLHCFLQFIFEKNKRNNTTLLKENYVKIYIDECRGNKKEPLSWEKCIDLHLKT